MRQIMPHYHYRPKPGVVATPLKRSARIWRRRYSRRLARVVFKGNDAAPHSANLALIHNLLSIKHIEPKFEFGSPLFSGVVRSPPSIR